MEIVYEKKSPQVAPGLRLYKTRARKKYLMDYNWMYTDFIEAHDGPILSRLEKLQLRAIVLYYR